MDNYFYKLKSKVLKLMHIKILKLKQHLGLLNRQNSIYNCRVQVKNKVKKDKKVQTKVYLHLHMFEDLLNKKNSILLKLEGLAQMEE